MLRGRSLRPPQMQPRTSASERLPQIKTWMINHIDGFVWDVITHPCPNFNGGLTKPPLKLGHG